MRSRGPVGVAVLLLGLLVTMLTGCSSDSDDDPGSSDPSSTSAAPTTSAPTQTEPPSPTVTPATGPEIVARNLDEPVLRLHLPDGATWRLQPGGDNASATNAAGDSVDIGTGVLPVSPGDDLERFADLRINGDSPLYPDLKRLEDREVAGVTGYVAEGKGDQFSYIFGGISGDSQVEVTFRFPKDDAQAREWIEATLASVEWL
jgi:hypothetical protein